MVMKYTEDYTKCFLFIVLLIYISMGSTAFSYQPQIFNHEVVEAVSNRNYKGVCYADADSAAAGSEAYIVYSAPGGVREGNLSQFIRQGNGTWNRTSLGSVMYSSCTSVAVGEVDPTKAGKEVYITRNLESGTGKITCFYKSGTWQSTDIQSTGGLVFKRVTIGDADSGAAGNELYAAFSNGVNQYIHNGSSWNSPVNLAGGLNCRDVAVGNIDNTLSGNEVLLGALNYFSYCNKQVSVWTRYDCEYFADRDYLSVAIGNIHPSYSGTESTYGAYRSSPLLSMFPWYHTYNGFAGRYGLPINEISADRVNNAVVTGDFDKDGLDEVVLASGGSNPILAMYYTTDGNTWYEQILSADREFYAVGIADVNGDGWLDILYGGANQTGVYLMEPPPPPPAGPADLNEDGVVNLIDLSLLGQQWARDISDIESGYVYWPDTLDLQYRAELCINALTRCTNPNESYRAYLYAASLYRKPPVLAEPYSSALSNLYGKWTQALVLCRMATQSTFNTVVDDTWKQTIHDIFAGSSPSCTIGVDGGRMLATLSHYYLDEQDATWLNYAQRMVNSSIPEFVDKGSWGYYGGPSPPLGWDATFHGWILQGLADHYRVTGDATTGSFGNKIAYYLKDYAQVFDADGRWLASHGSGSDAHFHHNGNCVEALSEWVLASNDPTLAAFVNSCYQYGKSAGEPLTGWFPEYIGSYPNGRNVEDFEADGVYDMIQTALNLSRAGFYDYWDDVDTYIRNMTAESQLTSGWWIYNMVKNLGATPVGSGETADDVPARVIGCPASWGGMNDFVKFGAGRPAGAYGCCLGNSGRVWYHIWSNILNYDSGNNTLSVNLLLNRFSEYADVASFLPYEGRAEITVNQTLTNLLIRIPGYVTLAEVDCSINGQIRSVTWDGRYLQTGPVSTGDQVVITFPISERTEQVTIGGGPTILETFELTIRGNTVVAIDPPGVYYPYFKGQHYRTGPVQYKKVKRVLGKDIKW